MPVPFETLLPYGICMVMFGISGGALAGLRHIENGGKRPRHNTDAWDKQMMERDLRLTGSLRGQTDKVYAPKGFEVNKPWKVEKPFN